MSLGVLNNLSAMYAANNLNNTQNSLSKTLQQLSSGSRINSGADDSAGLSLVNGLSANATALSQSQTNATEGVGLLQVADGALSQVTNLLNRAVTLATEVSNGTLNGSQGQAANQEYQSILAEINNIGSTTTYNQQKVFGQASDTTIYTGDSSSQSASIDNLHFSAVSASTVGDAGGKVNYSSGQANQFFDLTKTTSAGYGDKMAAGSLAFDYLLADGTTHGTATVTVTANETVGSVIKAINGLGIGVNATLATAASAGAGGTQTDTGIEISGQITTVAGQGKAGDTKITATTIYDTDSGQVVADAVAGTVDAAQTTAKISYAPGSGEDLNSLGSLTANTAQSILTGLNTAISDVAAQDGYIGAQINTLNAVSQVLSTQKENVVAAQNAVQATDYATAASNMSKYQILSQTGISALAQANSMQQEVTKLLQ
jgi:flagellin